VNPRHSEEAEAFRIRVRRILSENLASDWAGLGAIVDRTEADRFVEEWRKVLSAHGLLAVSWPKEYGGAGLTKAEQVVLAEELAHRGLPAGGHNDVFGIKMLGNTLLRWGTERQKRTLLPRILSGQDRWCQGFSEPDAGSDLASLRTSAMRRGSEFVISGQKIWTSRAREANRIFLLARTNPDAPKHRGISFLLIDMEQPGIEVRPIKAMSGESEFNEVFFDGATTPVDNIIGEVDQGWAVASTLLGLERGDEAAIIPINLRAELERLMAMARERGRTEDPIVRQRVADVYIRCEIMRYIGLRILTGVINGGSLGPESSISKLYWSEYHKRATKLAVDVLGSDALVIEGRGPLRAYRTDDPGAPNSSGSWLGAFYNSVAGTIMAGTSEVQRNILGQSVLGLPREPN
jgi:hypothetical protein